MPGRSPAETGAADVAAFPPGPFVPMIGSLKLHSTSKVLEGLA